MPPIDGFAVDDQELRVVDLVAAVVHRVDALGHPKRVKHGRRISAGDHRRIGDHAHRNSACNGVAQLANDVRSTELVHLNQHARAR